MTLNKASLFQLTQNSQLNSRCTCVCANVHVMLNVVTCIYLYLMTCVHVCFYNYVHNNRTKLQFPLTTQ